MVTPASTSTIFCFCRKEFYNWSVGDPHHRRITNRWTRAAGACFATLIRPATVEWIRAAASTQPLARYMVGSNMVDAPYTVTIVVDPEFGDRLYAVAKETPVWIVDTPVNRAAAEVVRAQNSEQCHQSGVTTFQMERNSTPEEWCANILGAVDLHHGEYSHDPPYAVVEVIGAPLTVRLRQAFGEYQLNVLSKEQLASRRVAQSPLANKALQLTAR
ncbi:MAG: hypothetical protein ACRD9S_10380 [Pyrinomonadaceae bacterium]